MVDVRLIASAVIIIILIIIILLILILTPSESLTGSAVAINNF